MIVKAVFHYEAQVLLRRKRNATTRVYTASCPVEIREIAPTDAPVALRYDSASMGRPTEVELRWFEGELWEAHPPARDGEDDDYGSLEWLARESAKAGAHGIISREDRRGETARKAIEDDTEVKEVVDVSDRAYLEGRARNYGTRSISVDGRVWRRTTEPMLNASHYPGEHKTVVRVVQVDMPGRGEMFFRMDHAHRVEELLDVEGFEVELPRVEILIPEAVRSRIDEHNMVARGKAALSVMKDYVLVRDVAYFAAFAGLRDVQEENAKNVLDREWDMRPYANALTEALDAAAVYAGDWSGWIGAGRAAVARWEGGERADFGWTASI